MRSVQLKSIFYLLTVTILFSSCSGLDKMKKNAELIRFKVEPEVLEVHGGKVPINITAKFPPKYFNKKAIVVATPVLKYNGEETKYKSIALQGEDVLANNKVVEYNRGGNFRYNDQIDYNDDMRRSELYLHITAEKGSKAVQFEPIKIADGIMATGRISGVPKTIAAVTKEENTTGKYNPATDAFQRNVQESKVADVHYTIGRSDIRKSEAEGADVKELETYTKDMSENEKAKLKKIEISSYASPDGSIDVNMALAAKRKNSSLRFMLDKFREAGINVDLKTRYTPEDWQGFKELMEQSDIQDKELILRVLSMYKNPEVREREMRNLAETFTEVADRILPQLRRSKFTADVERVGKSDDELMSLAIAKPSVLNQAELIYAASLFDDDESKLSIYKTFTQQFPSDWRGHNNVGHILSKQMKFTEAKPYFEKAEQLKNDNLIVKNNLGAIALFENNVKDAEILLGAASGITSESDYNQGMVNLKKGEYDKAVLFFQEYNDINTAVAKLMTGDINGAQRDLTAYQHPNCYMKEYLLAVVGARKDNPSMVMDKLQKAIKINPKVKEKAKTDIEFARYFTNSNFQKIVE